MIKCPNCGSTAQVHYTDIEKFGGKTFEKFTSTRPCICGCGAIFEETHIWQYIGVQTKLIEVQNNEKNN